MGILIYFIAIFKRNHRVHLLMLRYFILNFQEWQEFLDRAFSILIPQVLDQPLDGITNMEEEKGICIKFDLVHSNLIH